MDDDSVHKCMRDDCNFETDDVFEYIDHIQADVYWALRISKNFTFNLYKFLKELNSAIIRNDNEDAFEMVQSVASMLFMTSEGAVEEMLEESYIKDNADSIIDGLERMLKDERNK